MPTEAKISDNVLAEGSAHRATQLTVALNQEQERKSRHQSKPLVICKGLVSQSDQMNRQESNDPRTYFVA